MIISRTRHFAARRPFIQETLLLVERLRVEWRAREAAGRFHETIEFEDGELVLGAGTTLFKVALEEQAASDPSSQEWLSAVLSIAYGRAITQQTLGHLRAAAGRWREGDAARASLHIALTGLGPLDRAGARRLFVAEELTRAGVGPELILDAFQAAVTDPTLLKYNQAENRVPAGNGRVSGRWTDGTDSGSSGAPPPKPNPRPHPNAHSRAVTAGAAVAAAGARMGGGLDLGALSQTALKGLTTFLAGLGQGGVLDATIATGGAVGAFGLLFVPSHGPKGQWVHVGGPGDVSYYHNPDQLSFRFQYTTADGVRHTQTYLPDPNGDFRNEKGKIIARALKAGAKAGVIISTEELLDEDNDGKLCPAPVKDRGGELGAAFEDYGKARFNPGNPTPHGMGYQFKNPITGSAPIIDDCQQKTGDLNEYKGPNYEDHLRARDIVWISMERQMLKQSLDQVQSKGDRTLFWTFDEKPVADHMANLFAVEKQGREKIVVQWWPMPRKSRK